MSTPDPVIRCHEVSKRLGGRWVLSRLSFSVARGASVFLSGDNGAGKTTLLKILATLQRPNYGSLELFGTPLTDVAQVRTRLGLFTHATHLYDALSGRDNLLFSARALGKAPAEVDAALERVGLTADAARPTRVYSAGMKRRLMLARLFVRAPELVLLDEPWAALDTDAVALMTRAVRDWREQGKTLVIATHDHERATPLCDERLELVLGKRRVSAA